MNGARYRAWPTTTVRSERRTFITENNSRSDTPRMSVGRASGSVKNALSVPRQRKR
jgi:hypothetical protein